MLISDWSSDVCSSDLSSRFRLIWRITCASFLVRRQTGPAPLRWVRDARGWMPCEESRPRRTRPMRWKHTASFLLFRCRASNRHGGGSRSEEHTSELQSLMRISYAVFCLKKKKTYTLEPTTILHNNRITYH